MKLERITTYCTAIIRVFGIIGCALFLPWFFLVYRDEKAIIACHPAHEFRLGVENLTPRFIENVCFSQKKSCKVGLITNHTGMDQAGKSTIERLIELQVPLKKLFLAENGTKSSACPRVNPAHTCVIRIGQTTDIHTLLEQHICDLDILFFDMQDTGMRFYRTVSLLFEAIKVGALYGKTIVVLDRPNLLGSSIEGSFEQTQTALSLSIPVRYGMTIGELARHFNLSVLKRAAQLFVVPMEGYQRMSETVETAAVQLASLQTHIDTNHTTNLLSLLAEVHPIDMGVQTDYAYQCILLPECMHISKQTWQELAQLLKDQKINTSSFAYTKKSSKQAMKGLRFTNANDASLSSFNTLISVLRFFKDKGIRMNFSQNFDRALGTPSVRAYLEGRLAWEQLETDVNKGLKNFYAQAQRAFIYKPYPKIVMM